MDMVKFNNAVGAQSRIEWVADEKAFFSERGALRFEVNVSCVFSYKHLLLGGIVEQRKQ